MSNKILIEDTSIYDGWCIELNLDTGEFIWRDDWFTNRLSDEYKRNWEQKTREANPHLFEKSKLIS